ncbi:MAG TPA: glycosyltransferase family 39 protein [Anaerolineae bacterium]|nr:glycosyltransferase family 39 protein [Anaerolineae bacterium]
MTSRLGRWIAKRWTTLALLVLLPLAFAVRIYGIDWDEGHFFHPDERKILMVVEDLAWPDDWRSFLSIESPLNPGFFAYGSFPLYLLRLCSAVLTHWDKKWASLHHFYLLARVIAVMFDTVTVYATYLLARKVRRGRWVAVLAAAFVAFSVLHIQLAHFYTVDTLVVPFLLLAVAKAVDVARSGRVRDGVLLGALFGAALATKATVLPFAGVVVLAWMVFAWDAGSAETRLVLRLRSATRQVWRLVLLTLCVTTLCFLLLEPYALIDWYHFGQGLVQEFAMSQGGEAFPYTRQYDGTVPYVYQLRQILLFTMGVPLGLLGLGGMAYLATRLLILLRRRHPGSAHELVWLAWPVFYMLMQGAVHVKYVRYTLPVVPFLCIAGAAAAEDIWNSVGRRSAHAMMRRTARCGWALLLCAVLLSTVGFALAFLHIYSEPHPWLQATSWLCDHMSGETTLMVEYWDDPLPTYYANRDQHCRSKDYAFIWMDFHQPEDESKLDLLLTGLQDSDYVVLSSDRLYATISRLPARYPISSRYYGQLFDGNLGYELVFAPAVYPQLAGITLLDDPREGLPLATPPLLMSNGPSGCVLDLGRADESFTVYDHPQPLIFKKVVSLSRDQLRALLQPAD